ncbi:nucleotide sugar dehydrogenase [Sediminibacterium sp. KACHI17]|uniref:Nucleotide sugar dehydrogenase n=1 Tax=Sediminibacterium sp. KACHI17 TaxID=1751071 RepID=A0AAT9GIB1_9BACT
MKEQKIAIIGLGYVGLPLALAFVEHYEVIGFDIDPKRIEELQQGIDSTGEMDSTDLKASQNLIFTNHTVAIADCSVYIVTVPTPLHADNTPDLHFLEEASALIGKVLKKNDLVIYESTVYPGCTEEICVPVLVKHSGLVYNEDFFVGYSPERINPGDRNRKIQDIVKVVSGSDVTTALTVKALYDVVIKAGTHLAPSIKVAEAAKAVENAQRDVNISFMNELVLMFDKMGINTHDVLAAAKTKWNFLPFHPGLVGGHCIGVDPYYLLHKSRVVGYEPRLIAAGRAINDQMGQFVADKMISALVRLHNGNIRGLRVLILGFTFKENCSDTRNTKVADLYYALCKAGLEVFVQDNRVPSEKHPDICFVNDGLSLQPNAVIVAVKHNEFRAIDYLSLDAQGVMIFDIQGIVPEEVVSVRW